MKDKDLKQIREVPNATSSNSTAPWVCEDFLVENAVEARSRPSIISPSARVPSG